MPLAQARLRCVRGQPGLPVLRARPGRSRDRPQAGQARRGGGLLSTPEPDIGVRSLPESLARLAEGARVVRAEEITRFLPPENGGRPAAVLMLFADGPAGPDVLLI